MATRRELIIQFLKSKLDTVTGVGVYRSRVLPFDRAQLPAINIFPLSDSAQSNTIQKTDWTLTARIVVSVYGDSPDQVSDPIIQDVHSKLMNDLTVGGFAYDIQPLSVQYDFYDGDQARGIVSLDYRVLYRTLEKDLTT